MNRSRLERWAGADNVNRLSESMKGWYGPPIAVSGVPGNVWVHSDGDFSGKLRAGWEMTGYDRFEALCRRMKRQLHKSVLAQQYQLNAGFASLSDLISKVTTSGNRNDFAFHKVGNTGVSGGTESLWRVGDHPAGGSAPAAAPGGTAFTSASTGTFANFSNQSPSTQHFISGFVSSSQNGQTLLLYDLLFGVAKTMNSTATEAVTGTLTRYTNTTPGNPDYSAGNFLFIQVGGTALAATSHNWTVCQYTNQGGTAGQTLPSITGVSGAIVDRLDHPLQQWYAPLATGDTGVSALTQMQCSALVATGVIWFMIGHPIAWMICPTLNLTCSVDGINTAFNLVRIFDNACLAFLQPVASVSTATTYTGMFTTAWG
jgi:hypothetical protein